MSVPRMEVEDVEALIPQTVSRDGRISGLKEYAGRRVLVIVTASGEPAAKPSRRKA